MKKYVQQLVADILAAQYEAQPPYGSDLRGAFDAPWDFGEVDDLVAGRGATKNLAEIAGLTAEAFPPVDKLADQEMAAICKAMLRTLISHGISFEIPGDAPPEFNYQLLLDNLGTEALVPKPGSGAIIAIDFCSGHPDGCALKAYCNCLQYANELSEDEIFVHELLEWPDGRISKYAAKLLKKWLKARKFARKDGTFTIQLKTKYEPLSKKAKPIYEWLNIDMALFREFRAWEFAERRLILRTVQFGFPKMDWTWLEFTEEHDVWEMTTGLLEVRADFPKDGRFYTTRQELFWFLQLGDRMNSQREADEDDELPF